MTCQVIYSRLLIWLISYKRSRQDTEISLRHKNSSGGMGCSGLDVVPRERSPGGGEGRGLPYKGVTGVRVNICGLLKSKMTYQRYGGTL